MLLETDPELRAMAEEEIGATRAAARHDWKRS